MFLLTITTYKESWHSTVLSGLTKTSSIEAKWGHTRSCHRLKCRSWSVEQPYSIKNHFTPGSWERWAPNRRTQILRSQVWASTASNLRNFWNILWDCCSPWPQLSIDTPHGVVVQKLLGENCKKLSKKKHKMGLRKSKIGCFSTRSGRSFRICIKGGSFWWKKSFFGQPSIETHLSEYRNSNTKTFIGQPNLDRSSSALEPGPFGPRLTTNRRRQRKTPTSATFLEFWPQHTPGPSTCLLDLLPPVKIAQASDFLDFCSFHHYI